VASSRPSSPARDAALIAVFAGIVAALGVVPAVQPFGLPVPITAQSLGVILAGAILGARRGFAALALFVALVAVGLPLLAGGRGGLGVFVTPSAGFVVGFPVAAFVVGWITERGGPRYRVVWGMVAHLIVGIVVLYAAGLAGMVVIGGLPVGKALDFLKFFVLLDLVKVVLGAVIALGVHAAYPGLIAGRRERSKEPAAV
jgi:biotin transport system substrate-specific component